MYKEVINYERADNVSQEHLLAIVKRIANVGICQRHVGIHAFGRFPHAFGIRQGVYPANTCL